MGSPKFSLVKDDLKRVGRGALYAAGGAVCTYLLSVVPSVDLGVYTPAVVSLFSILLNLGVKFFTDTTK